MAVDKGKLHHWYQKARRIKTWQLVIVILLFSMLSVYLLRQNNLGMISRREAVVSADQKDGNIDLALKNLRTYMMHHMNTRMNQPIELQYSYNRDVQNLMNAAANSGSAANADVYHQAQQECVNNDIPVYAQCVISKTESVGGTNPVTQIQYPSVALFSYQFYSPVWSPDLAGFTVLITLLLVVCLVIRIIGLWLVRRTLKKHL